MGATIDVGSPPRRRNRHRPLGVAAAILAALALFGSIILLLVGVSRLTSWAELYGSSGIFTVEDCTSARGRLGSRVECRGELARDDSTPTASTLVGPKASFGSSLPRTGSEIEAYHRAGETGLSFPSAARSTELARAIVGLVPLLFLAGGLACWLVGWALTRNVEVRDAERHADRYRWPRRFVLRPRGALWAMVGLVWLVFDRVFVNDLMGFAGLG